MPDASERAGQVMASDISSVLTELWEVQNWLLVVDQHTFITSKKRGCFLKCKKEQLQVLTNFVK